MNDQEENVNQVKALQAKIAELDTVIANMPGHVYWLNRDNVYLGCNLIQAQILNFSSRQSIVGKKNADIVPEIAAELDLVNIKVMESNRAFLGEEHGEFNNETKIYLSQKAPLHDEKGNVVGLLGVSFDITDRKRMEKELKEAKEKAEIASQTKTEFIRNMEHDIRTPLCGIMSVVSHMAILEEDQEKKELVNDLHVATNELLNYLDNIIEFSQITTGAVPLIVKEFNLEQIVHSIANMELAAAKSKGLNLFVSYPDYVPKVILGDRFRLHRLLLNLVNNAIKFTQQGHVKISAGLAENNHGEEIVLKIIIEDTGIGIEEKNHEMIFDKFTRCDPSNKGLYKGTGLGLWIVKHFMKDLNGKIELESRLGGGTKFICMVPFKLL